MTPREDTEDYRQIFLDQVPLLDTRAPIEFFQGAFPTAVNLPLMNDEERHLVGIRYKESGQASAIELGHSLVCGELKQQRINAWKAFAAENPHGYLYCFRGGLRSQIVQGWLQEAGLNYPLVKGGYKALRRFLIEELSTSLSRAELVLISGKTGTGKTRVIQALEASIDLEGQARHRGSSFGQLPEQQPSQIDFENVISIEFQQRLLSFSTVFLEDEGRLIGRLSLPAMLLERMQQAPMMVVEETVASRVNVVIEDYVMDLGRRYQSSYGEEGLARHEHNLRASLERIRKRLGGVLYQEIDQLLVDAFSQQRRTASLELHRAWIEALLVKYYDPMYEYQLSKRDGKVLAAGSRAEVTERAQQLLQGRC